MQVSSAGVKLFFYDSYLSASHNYYKTTSSEPTLLAYLNTGTVQVSFSFDTNILYFYILQTGTSSKIVKYSLTTTYTLALLHDITLSDDSFTELSNTAQ